jgi:hypothetical protein
LRGQNFFYPRLWIKYSTIIVYRQKVKAASNGREFLGKSGGSFGGGRFADNGFTLKKKERKGKKKREKERKSKP